ncbi:hypothetical protein [Roseivirga pacifica]
MLPSIKKTVGARFRTTKPKDQIQQELIQTISRLGKTQIDDNGKIKIDSSQFSGTGYRNKLSGQFIENTEGKYTVNINQSGHGRLLSPGAILIIIVTLGIGVSFIGNRYGAATTKLHSMLDQIAKDIEFAFND